MILEHTKFLKKKVGEEKDKEIRGGGRGGGGRERGLCTVRLLALKRSPSTNQALAHLGGDAGAILEKRAHFGSF